MNNSNKKFFLLPLGELNTIIPFKWLHFELIETLSVAFIIAMFVKLFLFEIYKVPTSSMEPTILGDMQKDGQLVWSGDRVLVSKLAQLLKKIERFDPVGFHHPIQKNIVFVKRVVGLPEEKITVIDGDIYYNSKTDNPEIFHIAKKPLKIQESIWVPVNIGFAEKSIADFFKVSGMFYDPHYDTFRINANQASLLLKKPPTDKSYLDDGYNSVRDIKLFLQLQPYQKHGDFLITYFFARFRVFVKVNFQDQNIRLIVKEGNAKLLDKTAKVSISEYYPSSFALLIYDGEIVLKLDQKVVFQNAFIETVTIEKGKNGYLKRSFNRIFDKVFPKRFKLKITFHNFDGIITKLKLFRDIYYIGKGGFGFGYVQTVPPRSYVVMGDHSKVSYDSREWLTRRLVVGNTIYTLDDLNKDSKCLINDEYVYFKDMDGIPRMFSHNGCKPQSRLKIFFTDFTNFVPCQAIIKLGETCIPEIDKRFYFLPEEVIMGKPLMVIFPWTPKFRFKIIR